MSMDNLISLPVGTHVEYQGEVIFLNVFSTGSELGIKLCDADTKVIVDSCLEMTLLGIRDFDAGLSVDASNNMLLLTQWIPDTRTWREVSGALEKLLFQAAAWRLVANIAMDNETSNGRSMLEEMHFRDRILNSLHVKTNEM